MVPALELREKRVVLLASMFPALGCVDEEEEQAEEDCPELVPIETKQREEEEEKYKEDKKEEEEEEEFLSWRSG